MTDILRYFLLFLPSFCCLFWVVTLLVRRRNRNRSQNLWILLAALMGVSTYTWGISFSHINNYSAFYKLELLEAFTTLLLLPLLFFGFKSMTDEKPFRWIDYLWFLPAVLIGGSMGLLYIAMGDEQASAYVCDMARNQGKLTAFTGPVYRIHHCISTTVYSLLIVLQMVYLLIYSTICMVRYRRRLSDFFSNLRGKSIENGRAMLVLLYLLLVLSLVTFRGRFHYNEFSLHIAGIMLAWSGIIYAMGYNISRLRYTADQFARDLKASDEAAAIQEAATESLSGNTDTGMSLRERLLPGLERVMQQEQVFLNKELRLDEVARMVNSNRTYVSRLIHDEYGCNFSEFINRKRVEYARQTARQNPNFTQECIAGMSGFSHSSSFSRAFKQYSGMTFREFQKQILTESRCAPGGH